MNSSFKALIVTLTLLITFQTSALAVGPAHLLYPRDKAALQIIGIEGLASSRRVNTLFEQGCFDETFLCDMINQWLSPENHFDRQGPFWSEEAQVLIFGERHISHDVQGRMASMLPMLAREGFTILGMEMFNQSSQPHLDKFNNGELAIDELMEILEGQWFYDLSGYRLIIEQARELGVKLVALDNREHGLELTFSEDLIYRDQVMAAALLQAMMSEASTKPRALAYTGRLHAYSKISTRPELLVPTIASRLSHSPLNLKVESYLFLGERERGFLSDLNDLHPNLQSVFKGEALSPYIHGFIMP